MRKLDIVAAALLVVGGVNWGLWGLFEFDLIARTFGASPLGAHPVYTLVECAALYQVIFLRWIQERWEVAQIDA